MADTAEAGARARAFLEANLPSDWKGLGTLGVEERAAFLTDWRARLVESRFLAPHWPTEYGGGGYSELEAAAISAEFAAALVPGRVDNDGFGISLLGNTILQWGTAAQKSHFLPRIVSGIDRWCQGYSEPDAGSDLASLRCRAELDGDEWVLDGQKVWTSRAQTANWIFVLARTSHESKKQDGITLILCPMDQPGVEVRPITMMTGDDEFCETFFNGARAPKDHVIGGVGNGWKVAMTLLGNERGSAAATMPVFYRREFERLRELAVSTGRAQDPTIRERLGECFAAVEVMRYLGLRIRSSLTQGQAPGLGGSLFKLYWSEYHQRVTSLAMDILADLALAPVGRPAASSLGPDDPGAPNNPASWTSVYLSARGGTIYAGSSEIQRNILAERILGLPR